MLICRRILRKHVMSDALAQAEIVKEEPQVMLVVSGRRAATRLCQRKTANWVPKWMSSRRISHGSRGSCLQVLEMVVRQDLRLRLGL